MDRSDIERRVRTQIEHILAAPLVAADSDLLLDSGLNSLSVVELSLNLEDAFIPCWQAIRPAARTLSVSQGKGVTHRQAEVSAAMEAVEVWHAENLPPGPVLGTVRQLRPQLTYSPSALRVAGRSCLNDGSLDGQREH